MGIFGGGITKNETPTQGVLRECFKELGYNLKNPKLILSETISNGTHINIFKEEFDETKQIILGEGRGHGWFTIIQSNNLDIVPENLELLNKIKYLIFTN